MVIMLTNGLLRQMRVALISPNAAKYPVRKEYGDPRP